MKLIIDISEEDYKKCTDHLRGFNEKALKEPFMNATLRDRLEIALLHGTPFDSVIEDIKQEIEETYRDSLKEDINYAEGLERAWIIIDKHMRGKTNET